MGDGDRVIGYVRVSTEEQGNSGAGLDAQRDAIKAECDRRGWELVRIEEDVLSARTINRPGLQRTLEAVRNGEVAGIVVAKLDRLSRSIVDFGKLLEEARHSGWNIVGLDFGLDLSTPQGKLVANLLMSVAEWEREIIGQRTKEALSIRKAHGVKLGRRPSIPESTSESIRQMRRQGMTLQAICDRLNGSGVPTARGGRIWRPTSLRAVLRPA